MFAATIFDYYLIKALGYLVYDFITGHLWLLLRYSFNCRVTHSKECGVAVVSAACYKP